VVEPLRLHAPSRRDAVVVALPVVLAPMAGITNAAYRALCLEQGAGLYVCEMLTSRGIIAGDHRTHSMLAFDPSETIRSVQLYGVDPKVMAHATRVLITDHGVHHVDLNFGCPVPKVTRKGGGGVLPYKRDRLRAIIRATVRAADEFGVPVTVKTRIGIDETHETFLDTGFIAEEEGVAAIALHARTVQQAYSGRADWSRIAELKQAVGIPVLGNGDLWEAEDALRMMAETGCDGVVIGRGCLGRPWLFGDLAAAFAGLTDSADPVAYDPAPEAGTNLELVVPLGEESDPDTQSLVGIARMRVLERGVGEALSYGAGCCAVAVALHSWAGPGAPEDYRLLVPGGEIGVHVGADPLGQDSSVLLTGPAAITGRVTVA